MVSLVVAICTLSQIGLISLFGSEEQPIANFISIVQRYLFRPKVKLFRKCKRLRKRIEGDADKNEQQQSCVSNQRSHQ